MCRSLKLRRYVPRKYPGRDEHVESMEFKYDMGGRGIRKLDEQLDPWVWSREETTVKQVSSATRPGTESQFYELRSL